MHAWVLHDRWVHGSHRRLHRVAAWGSHLVRVRVEVRGGVHRPPAVVHQLHVRVLVGGDHLVLLRHRPLVAELTEHHWLALLVVEHPGEVRNVLHGVRQDRHFRHLLEVRRSWQVLFQGVKAAVHSLHPVPLPLVPLDCLDVLLGFDLVPVDRVNGHRTRTHRVFPLQQLAVN